MSVTAARQAAFRVLRALRSGELLDRAVRREIDPLPVRDRAFARELVMGTVRLRGRLDASIERFSKRPIGGLDAEILDGLRLGAYQLFEMEGVPAYAAVSQTVELVKASHPGGAGLVNAVLHALQRAGPPQCPPFAEDPLGWLTGWGSHPRWLVERWLARFGEDATRRLVEADNERAVTYLRPIGANVDDTLRRLARIGIAAETTPFRSSIRLADAAQVGRALEGTAAIVQDPAATAVAEFAEFEPGIVADLCAAPGGKALVLADGTNRASGGFVVAADVSAGRLRWLEQSLDRLPLPVVLLVADARAPAIRPVSGVLLDAPCTGTGTLRRHPDGRWRVSPDDLMALAALQAQILDATAQVVRPGGLLVYATCSLEREENEDQVETFLERHREFEIEPPTRTDPAMMHDGMLRIVPHVHGCDGSFAARMRRM